MNYLLLKQKLQSEEMLALENDSDRLDSLTSLSYVEHGSINIQELKAYLKIHSLWLPLKNSSTDSAVVAFDTISDEETREIDISTSIEFEFFDKTLSQLIIDVEEITEQHKEEIIALGRKKVSWAEQNGYDPLRIGYFSKARAT